MKLVLATNANQPIASVDIPDTAIPYLRKVWGGGTNAQTATNVLRFMLKELRNASRAAAQNEARTAAMETVASSEQAAATTFDAGWAE